MSIEKKSKLVKYVSWVLVAAFLLVNAILIPTYAQTIRGDRGMGGGMKKTTHAQRLEAARLQVQKLGTSTTAAAQNAVLTDLEKTVPHYFGPYSNWANSPMPEDGATVEFLGGNGTGATATAQVTNGAVTGITVTAPGSGYTEVPAVKITGGAGSGAAATAVLSGMVNSLTIADAGAGYGSATVTITDLVQDGPGAGAAAEAIIDGSTGGISEIRITDGGTGYTANTVDTVNVGIVIGGLGNGAAATATVDENGVITAITVDAPGAGYGNAEVVISGDGDGATAKAFIAGSTGGIDSLQLGAGGAGYTAAAVEVKSQDPNATVTPAAVTATLLTDTVKSVTLDNGGANYYLGGIRKFVDTLPGLTADNQNNLGQYIPVAVPDKNKYPGSDYYEIELVEYTEKMHSDLKPTTLRGYRQVNTNDPTISVPHYLGPLIVAEKDRPVRIKFINKLPTGLGGNLFLPVDTTLMGAGDGPISDPLTGKPIPYTQNRATLHLHGGRTPWISDGTQHQWITPAGEDTPYPEGVSVADVPDMETPGPGEMTFYYSNQQSARLMFYHDHSFGITRLNVYAGEAAGYILTDPVEQDLVTQNVLPAEQIPLILQDKTFLPDEATLMQTDPTWPFPVDPTRSNLWLPHVYMPNQNPEALDGTNPFGRWDYGPWFWPPWPVAAEHQPKPNPYYDPNDPNSIEPSVIPGLPNLSVGMEAFMDTPLVNGTVYPTLEVDPKAYRFRVLNAANDRFFNLQLHQAVSDQPMWNPDGTLNDADAGEVRMVNFDNLTQWPAGWPSPDLRDGGIPDPNFRGPKMIQIGTEGGFLPTPTVFDNIPIGFDNDPKSMTVGNIKEHNLFLGPAERADVIVDFSQFAGKTLILYNDAPAAVPANDPRYDYYTGNPDLTEVGGAKSTKPGYGPNIRTVMQIRVKAAPPAQAFDMVKLNNAFTSTVGKPSVFERSQDPIIVPQAAYNSAYNKTFPSGRAAYVRIQDTAMTFTPMGANAPVTITFNPKAIAEEFENEYGRMSAFLGVEVPFTNGMNQTTIFYTNIDPVTEIVKDNMTPLTPVQPDGTQIWKITHNGVDTHPIHFHAFDVQVVNRVDWAGVVKPPEPNELGWKDTVRMNPLEDCIVALKPVASRQPFGVPDSIRPLNPAAPLGSTMGFKNVDTNGNPITVINDLVNFGWEYVWHCHILSHEEMDMMRPISMIADRVLPTAPVLNRAVNGNQVDLTWTDATPGNDPNILGNFANEIGFRIERAPVDNTGAVGAFSVLSKALANQTAFSDNTADPSLTYKYRVIAYNAAGDSPSNIVEAGPPIPPPADPTNLVGTLQAGPAVQLTWMDNAANETGFVIERSVNNGAYAQIAAPAAAAGTGSLTYTDSAVASGNNYTYRVKAVNNIGPSAYSNTATVNVAASNPPTAPNNLKATLLTGPRVSLAWVDTANNENGFVVERKTGNGNYVQIAAPGPKTGTGNVLYTDTTTAPGTTYTYRVKAVNAAGSSAYSNAVTVVIAGVPAAPSNFRATAARATQTQDTVTLRWNDNSNNETAFTIQRATNASFTAGLTSFTVGANVTTLNQTRLPRNVKYYYRIQATNATGSSVWVNATPFPITTP